MNQFILFKKGDEALRVECNGVHVGSFNEDDGLACVESVEFLLERVAKAQGASFKVVDIDVTAALEESPASL